MSQHANTIELVKSLSVGPCSCTYRTASGMTSFCPTTGKTTFHHNPGPKTECLRCRARRCLETDSIEYEQVDHFQLVAHN
jgi:hypothetical protein